MTINLDSTEIQLTCPKCAHQFKERIGRLKNDPTIPCPGCRTPITINADGLRNGIESAGKALADLKRSIGKLGK